jgi:hypothetical protein
MLVYTNMMFNTSTSLKYMAYWRPASAYRHMGNMLMHIQKLFYNTHIIARILSTMNSQPKISQHILDNLHTCHHNIYMSDHKSHIYHINYLPYYIGDIFCALYAAVDYLPLNCSRFSGRYVKKCMATLYNIPPLITHFLIYKSHTMQLWHNLKGSTGGTSHHIINYHDIANNIIYSCNMLTMDNIIDIFDIFL